MDINTIIATLNSGIASEALGGLTSHGVLALIAKVKSHFGEKEVINKEKVEELISTNEGFKNDLLALEKELKGGTVVNMYGEKNNSVGVNFGTISF